MKPLTFEYILSKGWTREYAHHTVVQKARKVVGNQFYYLIFHTERFFLDIKLLGHKRSETIVVKTTKEFDDISFVLFEK